MKDYLIIGHGLAGAVISQLLLEKGSAITVFDQPASNHSSMIAAGLYNPITGRKMIKTWMADELFPVIEPFYQKLENQLERKFLNNIGIYRPFNSFEEQNDWDAKQADQKFNSYISAIGKKNRGDIALHDTYGGIHLKPSGYLNIPELLAASKNKLVSINSYAESPFDEGELMIQTGHVSYKQQQYRKLIFCNGIDVKNSAMFGWLPMHGVKGEILHGKIKSEINEIINRGVFILPKAHDEVRIGSNYENQFENILPSQKAREEILGKLDGLLKEPFDFSDSVAGIRPATKDRRPIIGKHPKYEHIYIFNGFGSKGVSLIPYFSLHFMRYLQGEQKIIQEVDISRFYSAYKSK